MTRAEALQLAEDVRDYRAQSFVEAARVLALYVLQEEREHQEAVERVMTEAEQTMLDNADAIGVALCRAHPLATLTRRWDGGPLLCNECGAEARSA